jgi:hypothetical protein
MIVLPLADRQPPDHKLTPGPDSTRICVLQVGCSKGWNVGVASDQFTGSDVSAAVNPDPPEAIRPTT